MLPNVSRICPVPPTVSFPWNFVSFNVLLKCKCPLSRRDPLSIRKRCGCVCSDQEGCTFPGGKVARGRRAWSWTALGIREKATEGLTGRSCRLNTARQRGLREPRGSQNPDSAVTANSYEFRVKHPAHLTNTRLDHNRSDFIRPARWSAGRSSCPQRDRGAGNLDFKCAYIISSCISKQTGNTKGTKTLNPQMYFFLGNKIL